jgi:hypothetical protein
MKRPFLTAFAMCSSFALGAAAADDAANPLVGVWGVMELAAWNLDANTVERLYGARPTGMLAYSKGGRMVIFLAGEERPTQSGPLLTDADRAANYRTTIAAYAGSYRVDGDKVTHRVATSLNPSVNGSDEVRFFKIEGEKLIVSTAPFKNRSTGAQTMAFLTYARLE